VLFSVSAKPGHEHAKTITMESTAGRMRHRSTLSIVPLGIVRRKAVSSLSFEDSSPYASVRPYRAPTADPEGRTMKLERRIRALEAKLFTEPLILHFADGSTRTIYGGGDFLMGLFKGVFGRADLGPGQAAQLDLIRQCVRSEEPGGGRMLELLRCLLLA
jgi:hypothetical protein